MNRKLLLALLCICNLQLFVAQECAFDGQLQLLRQNPEYIIQEEEMEVKIQNFIESGSMTNRMGGVLTIPIVVHVLHLGETVGTGTNISDAQIQSSIDNLNDFYRGQTTNSPIDFEIEFALAQRDPNCNATTGINRINASSVPNYSANGVSLSGGPGADQNILKDLSRWPETDYFNVWIVTEINNNNGGSGFQGYANFYNGNVREGSVMMYSVFGYDPSNANPSWPLNFARDNSTVVHEAGHYFHLYHTFQGDDTNNDGVGDTCPADSTVGVDSDGCADTVPHLRETSTCPATNTCTGNPWVDNNTVNNIMSYYFCTDRFTNDQKTRVRAAMEGTSLVNSKGGDPVDLGYAPPVAVCSNNATSTFSAGIVNVEMNDVSFASFSSGSDGGNIDNSGNCSNYFEIDASISNTVNVTMFPNNIQQLGIWIDWNDDGDFNDDAEKQHYSGSNAANSVVSVTLSYPASIPYGDYVRIRLLTELSTIYGASSIDDLPCDTTLQYGQSEDYAIYVQPSAGPTTYTYNNGWSPSDPNGIATASEDIIIASGSATINSNTTCNSVTVNSGAGLTINSATTLTVSNGLNLESSSTSYSSLILDGSVSGTINYERHVNINGSGITGSNDLISAPLTGQEFDDFAIANPNIFNNGSLYLFGPFDKTSGDYVTYAGSSTATLNAGVGYRAASNNNDAFTFTGTANNGVVTNDISNFGPVEAEWNLVGNPYPSYLNVQSFLNHEVSTGVKNIDLMNTGTAAIYGYDGSAQDGWIVYNLANISPTTVITPGQGFFVSADPTNAPLYDLEFTPAMRTTGTSDDFIAGRHSNSSSVLSKLNLSNSVTTSSTSIYFIEGTTKGLDKGYDASHYNGVASNFSIFTNLVENNEGKDIAIQSLPYNDFNNVVVPVGINASAGNLLTIALEDHSTLPDNIFVYLEDTLENKLTLLNTSEYRFTSASDLTGTGRFYLRYSSEALETLISELDHVLIYANNANKEVVIKGELSEKSNVTLYDVHGREILSKDLGVSNSVHSINVDALSTGVYIAKLSNQNSTKTQKLVIR
ncbi:GEVED domain-containing protein [Psychroserpens sp. S379A]|uniref:GEVED domain-containing protein n=1 Tax=Psychroserpens sp. S379A TaxID=3415137 RepID=UPI003C7D75CD